MLHLLDPLLAPIARLLIAQGVPFTGFADRMKQHYINAAKRALEADGAKLTDSRISAMTGLQRRDVARLQGDAAPRPQRVNYLAKLVAEWQTNPRYSGHDLPRTGDASFESLARAVHQDVHPRTMLDALLATDTVGHDTASDRVRLLMSSYQPLAGSEEQIDYLANNAGDHVAAATENVTTNAGHFERAAHYSDLTEKQLATLHQKFSKGQMALLKELSQEAADMKRAESGDFRFRAGAYFYSSKEPQR